MTVRVRLAPSPTGNLHIGTARTAVFNWLFARNQGGTFILRIEDTDLERSRPEYTQNILEGLTWLGLNWDEGPSYQSERLELYRQATQTLLDRGLAYRCYCSAAELEEMRAEQKARKEAPRYDNRHRNLTPEQEAEFEAQGRQPVIRFKIDDDREISWVDSVRGRVTWKGTDLGGDMVIARAAQGGEIGQPLYNLAVVVDDIDMKITHVIRGEDHIANTAKQILLYEAFGVEVPVFAHTPLILNQKGQKLSKRDGVTSISDFKSLGFTAEALANYMTLLGWTPSDSTQEIFSLAEAAQQFSFDRVNKAGAKFDWAKLDWINSQYLHSMPTPQLTDLLIAEWQGAGYTIDVQEDRAWLEELAALVGPSLTRTKDVVEMSRFFFTTTVEPDEEAATLLKMRETIVALEVVRADLKQLDKKGLTYSAANKLVKQVTKETKLKKGQIMKALRAALTGTLHGPDLLQSWVLLNQRGLDDLRFCAVLSITPEAVGVKATGHSVQGEAIPAPEPVLAVGSELSPVTETAVSQRRSVDVMEMPAPLPIQVSMSEVEPEPQVPDVVETPVAEGEPEPEVEVPEQTATLEVVADIAETPVVEVEPEVPAAVAETEVTEVEPEPEVEVVAETAVTEEEPEPEVPGEETTEPEPVKVEVTPENPVLDSSLTETVSETSTPQPLEKYQGIAMTFSDKPDTGALTETTASNGQDDQWQSIKETIISILSELPDYVGKFYREYQRPITIVTLIIASLITLKVVLGVLEVIGEIPLLSDSFELIGLGFSAWFIYRYLLFSSNRQELSKEVKAFKEDILGKS